MAQGFDIRGRLYLGQRLLGGFSRIELECQGSAGEIFRDVPKYHRQQKCHCCGKVQKSQLSQKLCHSLPLFALHESLAGFNVVLHALLERGRRETQALEHAHRAKILALEYRGELVYLIALDQLGDHGLDGLAR